MFLHHDPRYLLTNTKNSMLHKTKGIVLRAIKYGETSLIVNIYTELFGMHSYIVNGVRTHTKKGPGRASVFQSGAILDLVIYHNEFKNIQRLKEFKWHYLYANLFSDVRKNSVALFMVELLLKSIRQPETNAPLFYFIEDSFMHLDTGTNAVVANFALFFALHLATFLGFRISDDYTETNHILDLQDGIFVHEYPLHPHFLEGRFSYTTSQLLKAMQPYELEQLPLHHEFRRSLLQAYQTFYALHIADFGVMKTLPVLQEVLG